MYKTILYLLLLFTFNVAIAQQSKIVSGKATFYAQKFNGKRTYSGERFSSTKYTAAHRNFPLQSLVKVINPRNNRSVIVRINDRFYKKNFIDLTLIAAKQIDIVRHGVAAVKMQLLDTSFMQEYLNQSNENIKIEPLLDSVSETFPMDTVQYFYIRVASFKFKKNAELLVKKDLPEKYAQSVIIQKARYKGKPLYKVIIGPFATQKEANTQLNKLKSKFKDAVIVLKT